MNSQKFSKFLLLVLYIVVIVIQLVILVPYERVGIFVSKQNVPHTVTIGNGYDTLSGIKEVKYTLQVYFGRSRIGYDC